MAEAITTNSKSQSSIMKHQSILHPLTMQKVRSRGQQAMTKGRFVCMSRSSADWQVCMAAGCRKTAPCSHEYICTHATSFASSPWAFSVSEMPCIWQSHFTTQRHTSPYFWPAGMQLDSSRPDRICFASCPVPHSRESRCQLERGCRYKY